MGSQWASMAKDMMNIEAFRTAINKCAAVLEPEGVNLIDILVRSDESKFENILNSFVAIAAVQVALTDCLNTLGITPDGMIGHSVGELGCAYAGEKYNLYGFDCEANEKLIHSQQMDALRQNKPFSLHTGVVVQFPIPT